MAKASLKDAKLVGKGERLDVIFDIRGHFDQNENNEKKYCVCQDMYE